MLKQKAKLEIIQPINPIICISVTLNFPKEKLTVKTRF